MTLRHRKTTWVLGAQRQAGNEGTDWKEWMISKSENVGDRPIRNNFKAIIFTVFGIVLVAILVSIVVVHFHKPNPTVPSKQHIGGPAPSTQPQ
jgi:amino acid transporter